MIKLICGASKLKVDDFNYKNRSVLCEFCGDYAREEANHIIHQCRGTEALRFEMHHTLRYRLGLDLYNDINSQGDFQSIMMGRIPENIPMQYMTNFWAITCVYVSKMYWATINNRAGVG